MDVRKDTTFGSLKKYRDATDIVYKMLHYMRSEPKTQTDLMFEARMSYTQLKDYKNMLLEKGLIKITKSFKTSEAYIVTEKGIEVIQAIEKLRELLK